ncbi:molybdopterin-synthase small subunit [Testudinibacter sp. TR-2022]|uniref:molybdopterin-synthase small subunit n=1 Tax=Testudinibacter sp. TR-2022 TaxID=2585029 RepID=UPI00111AC699|nr:molybdopterin-synthase small subunit [Testudinibacter sp. TR-2022]TNH02470.1 molybdopterin-synthase small subunit [Pasteurellaceae bacterium Phil31]TNH10556.1 molybdopterin-synthase small subunit [Testudinibacter sp. TR-2022]TNH10966.1 molybdopterin-synthase small subunit [Testudinibacter sp. TR-2022]TNH13627.1 molybdopterin-synthase small subunit [Testudinibacter sp. TR-2022]TNH18165.1 molybdopterin-synthase small subunit [Testudinibacter sp. TR-2022]
MAYLTEIIIEKKASLPKQTEKLVNQLCNKLKNGAYTPDNKNIVKLKDIATDEVNDFLLECLAEYNKTERHYREHHDIHGLYAVWAILSFSRKENVLAYFANIIDKKNEDFFLNHLFTLLNLPNVQHPYAERIKQYYDGIFHTLPSYQLMEKLGIDLPNKYDWSVSLHLMNFGKWFTTDGLTDDEKEKQFKLKIYFGSPGIKNDTFKISIENSLSQKIQKISFTDSEVFTIRVDEKEIGKPNLLELGKFLTQVENYFATTFNTDDLKGDTAYFSTSKGISRKKIEQWIKNRFNI